MGVRFGWKSSAMAQDSLVWSGLVCYKTKCFTRRVQFIRGKSLSKVIDDARAASCKRISRLQRIGGTVRTPASLRSLGPLHLHLFLETPSHLKYIIAYLLHVPYQVMDSSVMLSAVMKMPGYQWRRLSLSQDTIAQHSSRQSMPWSQQPAQPCRLALHSLCVTSFALIY